MPPSRIITDSRSIPATPSGAGQRMNSEAGGRRVTRPSPCSARPPRLGRSEHRAWPPRAGRRKAPGAGGPRPGFQALMCAHPIGGMDRFLKSDLQRVLVGKRRRRAGSEGNYFRRRRTVNPAAASSNPLAGSGTTSKMRMSSIANFSSVAPVLTRT